MPDGRKRSRTELALRQRDSRRELFVEEVETDQAAGVGAVRRADPFPQQQETFVGTLDRVEQRGARRSHREVSSDGVQR